MSQLNAVQIVQRLTATRALTQPNALVSATDTGVVQMRALLEAAVGELTKRYEWQEITLPFTFNTVATQVQGYVDGNVPGSTSPFIPASAGFLKIFNDTLWDVNRHLPLFGPRKIQDFAMLRAIPVTGPFLQFNIINNQMNILPVPAAGDQIIGYYQSRNGWTASDGSTTSEFIAADTDLPILDNELVYQGLLWRWLQAKGLSYSEEKANYELGVMDAITRNRPRPKKSLSGSNAGYFDPIVIIPAGSWPVQT